MLSLLANIWWWSVMPIHMHDQLIWWYKTQYFVAEHIPSMMGSVFVSNDIFMELWFLQA